MQFFVYFISKEQVPNNAEIEAIAQHLSSSTTEDFNDFFTKLFEKTGATPIFPNDKSKRVTGYFRHHQKYSSLSRNESYSTMLKQWSNKGGSIRLLKNALVERNRGHEEIADKYA